MKDSKPEGEYYIMPTMTDSLEVRNISKNYEGKPLLNGINLQVKAGETLCLLGRSGSGKSTLLRIIAGIESADAGDVLWNGEKINDVPTWRRHFGLMFQDYALFPHRNVKENVAFGLRMQGAPKAQIQTRVRQVLDLVNMTGFEKRRVTDLSGGEQQRIALARALAPNPRLLMLDEPLAALDRALRMELQEELRALLHKTGIPAIYVTHDQEEAFLLGDGVAILADGIVAQTGTPRQVHQAPLNRKVADFLGMTNFINGKVVSTAPIQVETNFGRFRASNPNQVALARESQVCLLLRTQGARISTVLEGQNIVSGVVTDCVFHGDDYKITLQTPRDGLTVFNLPQACNCGDQAAFLIPEASVVVLA